MTFFKVFFFKEKYSFLKEGNPGGPKLCQGLSPDSPQKGPSE